jgi:hypothetical protein
MGNALGKKDTTRTTSALEGQLKMETPDLQIKLPLQGALDP